MIIFDANAILRYILNDIPEQAKIVADTILATKILILPEVIAEVVYVLNKHYGVSREDITNVIINVLNDTECGNMSIRESIRVFGFTNFDFVDCLLFAYSKTYKILTFDKKLNIIIERGL